MIGKVVEVTFTLIILYLVLKNAPGFSSGVNAISGAYTSAVKALQGR